jgi:hypothetical protein
VDGLKIRAATAGDLEVIREITTVRSLIFGFAATHVKTAG